MVELAREDGKSGSEKGAMMRRVFLGGSFDPFHLGHQGLLESALGSGLVDLLYLVPTARSPLKENPPWLSDEARLDQLEAVAAGYGGRVSVLDWEMRRSGVSYTKDTVAMLRERFPGDELWWVIGADQLEKLPRWMEIETLVGQIGFLVAARPGHDLVAPDLSGLRWKHLEMEPVDLSSTMIREALERGESVDCWLPPVVREWFQRRGVGDFGSPAGE